MINLLSTIRINSQIAAVLLAASCCAVAGTLPEVDLLDSTGARVGRARLRVEKGKCEIRLKNHHLAAGKYHPVLAKARQCFGGPKEREADVVGEAASVVIEGGAPAASIVLDGEYEMGAIERIIATEGLIFQMVHPESKAPAACGKVKRWFSPGREVRRGEEP